ncbi:AI-2E family transporter [Bradyrhizobium sp. 6(2017)]|uniref:AI-2E family transporter n=1 Tax=Bradyrhizobium sp. 6(2017) TaxID=1197460 RepID=UPI0013E17FDC|nr:AI-2E family transporter [Bradyrhizobium sp. 6(2017)]QIG94244.1 AI-2E family transporter [Bradyrhizobium sp. 6(2017)]
MIPGADDDRAAHDRLITTWVELVIRIGVLGLLLALSVVLIRPFITVAIWSIVLTVAVYPVYDWMAGRLGGRRRLAALLLTILNLLIVIGPATWLTLGLIDSLRELSEYLDLSALTLPPPPHAVKSWPIIGAPIYQFWDLASTNFQAALAKTAPLLKPVGGTLLELAESAGIGVIKFFVAIVIAGFLFSPAPSLVNAVTLFSRRLASGRGERFVQLAGATIRAVSRGVIGVSALQAFLAGMGLAVAGISGASLLTSAVLILGIIQVGPSVVLFPIVIWSWITMDPTKAILLSLYLIPVSLLDNVLRPLVMARGLDTPMLIILIGVLGGTLAYGITGLFLGPIVLAVIWELLVTWTKERESA